MAVLSPSTLNVLAFNPFPRTTITINGSVGDTCVITVTNPNVGTWSVVSAVNCTATPTSGTRASTTTLTLTTAGTYTLDINYIGGGFTYYGRVTGTISGAAQDVDPDPFPFTAKTGVARSTSIESDPITITGINAAAPITATNGVYYTRPDSNTAWSVAQTSGTITNNTQIKASVTSSSLFSTATSVNVKINNTTQSFTVTTLAEDKTPAFVDFDAQTNVAFNTLIDSNTQTITGINTPVDISIFTADGAEAYYKVNSGVFKQLATTGGVSSGDTVQVRLRSKSTFSTSNSVFVTIGDTTKIFTITTVAQDTTPDDPFGYTNISNAARSTSYQATSPITVSGVNTTISVSRASGAGEFSSDGANWRTTAVNVNNGATIYVRQTSSSAFSTAVSTTLNIGSRQATFTVTTEAEDNTPNDPFGYTSISGATISTLYQATSPITVSGVNTTISVSRASGAGEFSTDGANWRTTAVNVNNGATIYVRQTSSAAFSTAVSTTLNIGSRQATFTVTTMDDTFPDDPFGYTNISNAARSTSYQATSPITVSGVNTTISVSRASGAGEFSTDGANWRTTAVNVNNGATIYVRQTSSAAFSTAVSTTLNIGSRQATFTVTTLAADTTPDDPFGYTNISNAARSTSYQATSPITVSGVNTTISVSRASGAGEFSTDGANWRTTAVDVNNGATIYVRQTSSAAFSTAVSTTLNIGSRQATFTVTTLGADITPDDPFGYTNITSAARSTSYQASSPITVSGVNTTITVSIISGAGEFSTDGTNWRTTAVDVNNGATIYIRQTSSSAFNTSVTTNLSIGARTASFTITTVAQDTTPDDPFGYTNITNAARSTSYQAASPITVSGVNTTISVSRASGAGEFSTDGANWRTTAVNVNNGATIYVRQTSSAAFSTAVSTTLNIGSRQATFTVTTMDDTFPDDPFGYTNITNAARSTSYQAASPITVSGVNVAISVSIASGAGEFSTDETNWRTTAVNVNNGATIYVRQTSSAAFSTAVSTTLNIGSRQATFTVTTLAADTTPDDPFGYTNISNAARSTSYQATSPITVSGVNTTISVSRASGAGEFSTDGANWRTTAVDVNNGATIYVRQTSSAAFSTAVSTTLNIGSRQATFTVTTLAADTTPDDPFGYTNITNAARSTSYQAASPITVSGVNTTISVSRASGAGEFSTDGTNWRTTAVDVNNGATIYVRQTSSAAFSTAVSTTLNIGSRQATFTVTTLAIDSTPDSFIDFNAQLDVPLNTLIDSNTQTITGINTPVDISIFTADGAEAYYKVNSGVFKQLATTGGVSSGDTVQVRLRSKGTLSTSNSLFLTIGNTTKIFTITTIGPDTTPDDPFAYTNISNAARSTSYQATSPITVSGVNTTISVSRASGAGEFSTDGANWRTTAVNVNNGATIYVRQTSSAAFSTAVSTTLNIGSRQATFTVTTEAEDTTPDDPFGYTNVNNATRNQLYTATQPIQVKGINTSITVSRKSGSGEFSIDGTNWRTTAVNVSNLAFIYIRQTASALFNTASTTELNIGTRVASFTVTTEAQDNTPDPFNFGSDINNATLNTTYYSSIATITGINSATSLSFSEYGQYSKNGTTFTTDSTNVTVISGDTIQIALPSASTFSTTRKGTITIGGITSSFSVTTQAQDTSPDPFPFTAVSNAQTNLLYESNIVTISGINSSSSVTFSGNGMYRKRPSGGDWGAYTTQSTTASLGDSFQIRIQSASTSGTAISATLDIGGVTSAYIVTTAGATTDTTPDQFPFTVRSDAELNTVYTSNQITVSGINSPAALSIVGGQYELNTNNSWLTTATNVANGTLIRVRATSSSSYSTLTRVTLTIGGVQSNFDIVTKDQVASSDYGFEVYNTSGVKTVSATTRTARLVASGSTTVTVQPQAGTYSSAAINIPGIATDDSWQILIYEDSSIQTGTAFYTSIGTNVFYIIGSNAQALPGPNNTVFNIGYYVLRS